MVWTPEERGSAPWPSGTPVLPAQLPPEAIDDATEVASQAAMLALVAQKGDIALRTDTGVAYVLTGTGDPTVLANWKALSFGTSSAAALASAQLRAGSDSQIIVNGTSYADLDATNLVVTFTAPTSGAVIVVLSGVVVNSPSGYVSWNVRDSGGDVASSGGDVTITTAEDTRASMRVKITGLTGGSSYTWKWGGKQSVGGASAAYHKHGPNRGPLLMEVWAA